MCVVGNSSDGANKKTEIAPVKKEPRGTEIKF